MDKETMPQMRPLAAIKKLAHTITRQIVVSPEQHAIDRGEYVALPDDFSRLMPEQTREVEIPHE